MRGRERIKQQVILFIFLLKIVPSCLESGAKGVCHGNLGCWKKQRTRSSLILCEVGNETTALPHSVLCITTGSEKENVQSIQKRLFHHFPNCLQARLRALHFVLHNAPSKMLLCSWPVPSVSPKTFVILRSVINRKPNTLTHCFYEVKNQSQLISCMGQANTRWTCDILQSREVRKY